MRKKIKTSLLWLLWGVVLASCGRDSYYVIPVEPGQEPMKDPGTVKVDVLPAEGDSEDTKDAVITLIDDSGKTVTLPVGESVEIESGTYQLVAVNPAGDTTAEEMKGLIVTAEKVSLAPDAEGELPSVPAFEAGTGTLVVSGNRISQTRVSLSPMSRGVELKVSLTGAGVEDLQMINARIYGISASRSINGGFSGGEGRAVADGYFVTAALTPATDGTWLLSAVRLLGIDTNQKQTLFITGTLKDGTEQTLALDVTPLFEGFNSGPAAEPLKLAATLVYEVEAGLTGTVTDWTPGWDTDI